jgi:hypothetical protein
VKEETGERGDAFEYFYASPEVKGGDYNVKPTTCSRATVSLSLLCCNNNNNNNYDDDDDTISTSCFPELCQLNIPVSDPPSSSALPTR